ncbi:MAG: hypothetical protein WBA46_13470 [Thermomicrobiales bacterium]
MNDPLHALRLNRRSLLALGASAPLAAALGHHAMPAAAQQAYPAASPAASPVAITPTADGYDLPLVSWDLRDDRIVVSPDTFASGWNRVIVANNASGEDHLLTFLLPDGKTDKELLAALSGTSQPPDWVINAVMPGNPDRAGTGVAVEGFVNYDAGSYLIIDPFGTRTGAFTVKPATAPAQITLKPAVTVGTIEMDFTGLDKPVPAGRNLWLIDNTGETFHELAFGRVPDGTTKDEVLTVITATFATPTYNPGPGWEMPTGNAGLGILSKGRQAAVYVDLPAGTYAAMCFAPMNFSGPPHAAMGMIRVFTVA